MNHTDVSSQEKKRFFPFYFSFLLVFLALAGRSSVLAQDTTAGPKWRHPAQIAWEGKPVAEALKAAERGEALAQYYLAWINWFGERGQTNHSQSMHWFHAAATNGVAEAQLKMGVLSEYGIGRPRNVQDAARWYRQAAAQSNVVAQLRMMLFDRPGAPAWTRLAADRGYGPAGHQMNTWLRDTQEAIDFCQKAALQGVADAQYALCGHYMSGRGVAKDLSEAFKWLWLAAEAGEPEARRYLNDQREAFSSSQQAEGLRRAKAFSPKISDPAWSHSEWLFYDSPGALSPGDGNEALEIQAKRGDASAQFRLGLRLAHPSRFTAEGKHALYRSVNQVSKTEFPMHERMALKWLLQAADQGQVDALYQVAMMYLNGHGTAPDQAEAQRWLLKAASLGHREAQHHLARLCELSVNSLTGLSEALHWHRQAAAAGQPQSLAWLQDFTATNFPSAARLTALPSVVLADTNTNLPAAIRLAVVATDRRLQEAADLLSVFWSHQPGLVLLERQEIERVMQEQALAAGRNGPKVRLGELLGAEGIVFLDLLGQGESNRLSVQLVATKPGAIVAQLEEGWPLKNVEVWAGQVAARQAAWLPKLSVARGRAVPISILNLSSALATPDSAAFDRLFTELLLVRLARQPELFVLERKRLNQVADEKWQQRTDESFWNGGLLLDGSINREGVQAGKMTVHLRLTRPDGTLQEIALSGLREDPLQMIETAAQEIVKSLGAQAVLKGWDPMGEAVRYYDEARWQMASKFLTEAQRAAETAWALGLRALPLAEIRIAAYIQELPADPVTYENDFIKQPRPPLPVEAQIDKAVLAARYYLEQNRLLGTNAPPDSWVKLGEAVLHRTSTQLSWIHQRQVHMRGKIVRPEALREVSRELADYLAIYSTPRPLSHEIFIGWLELRYGTLWEEDLAAGARRYQAALRRGELLAVLGGTSGRMPVIMPMLSWRDESITDLEQFENEFWDNWKDDDSPMGTLSWHLIRLKRSPVEDFERRFDQLLDSLAKNQDKFELNSLPHMEKLLDMLYPVSLQIKYGTPLRKKYDTQLRAAVKAKLVPIMAQLIERRNVVFTRELAALMDQAAAEGQSIEFTHGSSHTMRLGWNEAAAKLLVPSLLRYEAAVPATDGFARSVRDRVIMAYRASGTPVPPSPKAQAKQAPRPPPVRPVQVAAADEEQDIEIKAPVAPKARPSAEPVVLTLQEPVKILPAEEQTLGKQSGFVAGWVVAGEHLWLEVWDSSFSAGSFTLAGNLVAFNLNDRSSQVFRMPASFLQHLSPNGYQLSREQRFTVVDGKVLYLTGDSVWELVLPKGEWRKTAWTLPAGSQLKAAHGRVFAAAPDSISELQPNGSVRVLASNRRRPAFTPLDETRQLNRSQMLAVADSSLRVVVGGKIVDYSLDRGRWRTIGSMPDSPLWKYELCGQGIVFHYAATFTGPYKVNALLPERQETIPLITSERHNVDDTRWVFPTELSASDRYFPSYHALALESDALWCWYFGSSEGSKPGVSVQSSQRLVWFKTGVQKPMLMSLRYQGNEAPPENAFTQPSVFFTTPGHLALLHPDSRRIWVIKRSDFKSRLEAYARTELEIQKERLDYLKQRLDYWRKISDFNGNKNGRLEPEEFAAMRQSQGYKQDSIEIEKLTNTGN